MRALYLPRACHSYARDKADFVAFRRRRCLRSAGTGAEVGPPMTNSQHLVRPSPRAPLPCQSARTKKYSFLQQLDGSAIADCWAMFANARTSAFNFSFHSSQDFKRFRRRYLSRLPAVILNEAADTIRRSSRTRSAHLQYRSRQQRA